MSTPHIMIATPTYDGRVEAEYVISIQKTMHALDQRGVRTRLQIVKGMVVNRARNLLTSIFFHDDSATHLLFIDGDHEFRPEAVLRLLDSEHAFCGLVYPGRELDYKKFFQASRVVDDPDLARSIAQTYVTTNKLQLKRMSDGRMAYDIREGFVRTQEIGCGITLIQRSVIEKVIQRYPELRVKGAYDHQYRAHLVGKDVLQVFEPLQRNNFYVGEDLAFCWRWIDGCQGEIWALVDEHVGHVGTFKAEGRAYDKLVREDPTPVR